jgi:hypothetical protein
MIQCEDAMKRAIIATMATMIPFSLAAQQMSQPQARPPVGVLRLPPRPATTVEEITVLPRAVCLPPKKDPDVPPPKIVDSFPANGSNLRPGLVVIRVTFDRPMSCEGFIFSDPLLSMACPPRLQDMLLSFDRLTIRTVCRLQALSRFSLLLNQAPDNGPNRGARNTFESLAGWPAPAYKIGFTTSNAPSVRTIREALLEDPRPGVKGLDPAAENAGSAQRYSPWQRPPQ